MNQVTDEQLMYIQDHINFRDLHIPFVHVFALKQAERKMVSFNFRDNKGFDGFFLLEK